jgi:hypothetical protein
MGITAAPRGTRSKGPGTAFTGRVARGGAPPSGEGGQSSETGGGGDWDGCDCVITNEGAGARRRNGHRLGRWGGVEVRKNGCEKA